MLMLMPMRVCVLIIQWRCLFRRGVRKYWKGEHYAYANETHSAHGCCFSKSQLQFRLVVQSDDLLDRHGGKGEYLPNFNLTYSPLLSKGNKDIDTNE